MKQAIDCDVGTLFRWQDDVYVVIKHTADHVIVWRCASQWPGAWHLVGGAQHEQFNQYCEVEPVIVEFK